MCGELYYFQNTNPKVNILEYYERIIIYTHMHRNSEISNYNVAQNKYLQFINVDYMSIYGIKSNRIELFIHREGIIGI